MDSQETIFALILAIIFGGSGAAWVLVFKSCRSGQPLLSYEPRDWVPWGLVDLIWVFLLLLIMPAAATIGILYFFEGHFDPARSERKALVLVAGSASSLAVMLLAMATISMRTAATGLEFGFDRQKIGTDLRLGGVAFVLLVGPVLLIQAVLVHWWPSQHPIIEMVRENREPLFLAASAFTAVVVAPITEEFIFRGLLQGWLEKLALFRGEPRELVMGRSLGATLSYEARPEVKPNQSTDKPDLDVTSGFRGAVEGQPWQPSNGPQRNPTLYAPTTLSTTLLPILVSATVFALMHWSHGPDPIPLFAFALGLGFVYQRTHRLLPCIIVHALLNSLSFGLLLFDVYFGKSA